MVSNLKELLWAVAALAIAVVVAYGLVLLTPHDAQGEVSPIQPSIYNNRLDQLDREALEIAYRNHIVQMFEGWMKDPTAQPVRAQAGHRNARKAFIDTMTAFDQRK